MYLILHGSSAPVVVVFIYSGVWRLPCSSLCVSPEPEASQHPPLPDGCWNQRKQTAGSSNQERESSSRSKGANLSLQEVGLPLSYKYNLIICCNVLEH